MNKLNLCKIYFLGTFFLALSHSVCSQTYSAEYINKRDALIKVVRADFDSIMLHHPEEGLEFIQKSFLAYENDLVIKAWVYHLKADYYGRQSSYDSNFFYLEKSVLTISAKEDPLLFSRNKTQIALSYAADGEFKKSLKALNEAKAEMDEESSNIIHINYYENLGQYYLYKSEYAKAIECFNQSVKYINREPEGDDKNNRLARAYTGIGSLLNDKKKAVGYYKKARKLLENKDIEGEHYCDICIVSIKEIESSPFELNNLDTAIQYFKGVGGKTLAIKGMIARAAVFAAAGSEKRAESLYLEALELGKSINFARQIASIRDHLGALYIEMGQYNKAITYAMLSLDSTTQRVDVQFSNLKTLYLAYKGKKDYKKSLFYMEKFLALKEKSKFDEKKKVVNELETKYKAERKQLQIQSLMKENSFIKQRRWLLVGLTALLFLIPIIYLSQRSKRRKKTYQAKIAQMQLASLKSQMSPHFIFNSINSIKGMIINDATEAAAIQLSKFSKFMRNILNYSGGEFISLYDEIDFLKQYVNLENFKREFAVNVSFYGAEKLVHDDVEVLPFLLQPFLENSFEHAFTKEIMNPKIDIKFLKQGDWLLITIEDNGIGQKRSNNLGHISKGTILVRNRLDLHNGTSDNVKIDYKGLNKGTRVEVKLKV